MLAGPDVSGFQGTIAWPRVRLRGEHKLAFAIVKASEGDALVDPQFQGNWRGIHERELIRGAYHVATLAVPEPSTIENVLAAATTQARHFLSVLHPVHGIQPGDLPPILDLERSQSSSTMNSAQLYEWVKTWVQVVGAATGRKPLIYTGDLWKTMLNGYADVWGCPLWLADWAPRPQLPRAWKAWTFWQFTDRATVEGIAGYVDVSYFHGSRADLDQLTGSRVAPPQAT